MLPAACHVGRRAAGGAQRCCCCCCWHSCYVPSPTLIPPQYVMVADGTCEPCGVRCLACSDEAPDVCEECEDGWQVQDGECVNSAFARVPVPELATEPPFEATKLLPEEYEVYVEPAYD